MPMRFPRFQFTIRRLIVLIAICGVCFALLRTPFGFVVVCVGFVLPGFLIGRARRSAGIIAGALSASIIAALLVAGLILLNTPPPFFSRVDEIKALLGLASIFALFAFIFGLLVSGALYVVVEVTRICLHAKQRVKSSEEMEIRWLPPDDDPSEVR